MTSFMDGRFGQERWRTIWRSICSSKLLPWRPQLAHNVNRSIVIHISFPVKLETPNDLSQKSTERVTQLTSDFLLTVASREVSKIALQRNKEVIFSPRNEAGREEPVKVIRMETWAADCQNVFFHHAQHECSITAWNCVTAMIFSLNFRGINYARVSSSIKRLNVWLSLRLATISRNI